MLEFAARVVDQPARPRRIEQQGTIPWQTYQEADGSVIYGDRALP